MRNYKPIKKSQSLEDLIQDLNLLPEGLETELEKLREQFRTETREAKLSEMNKLLKTVAEYCEKLRHLIPPELASKFVDKFTGDLSASSFLQAHWGLRNLVIEKKMLKTIMEAYQITEEKGFETVFGLGASAHSFGFGIVGSTFSFNADSTIKRTDSQLLELLEGNKIPISRIRECPICSKIFWAKRTDAKTCGDKQCVEKLGGKKYHSENKEVINRKKRKKYYEDNDIDYCPECVRPKNTCEC